MHAALGTHAIRTHSHRRLPYTHKGSSGQKEKMAMVPVDVSFRSMSKNGMKQWIIENPGLKNALNYWNTATGTLLITAVEKFSDPAFISWLVDHGCHVDGHGTIGMTPLFWASVEVIPVLLEKGANHLMRDNVGRTALMFHAMRARADCVERLLQYPRVLQTIDLLNGGHPSPWAGTALHIACYSGKTDVSKARTIDVLLRRGAFPFLLDDAGRTPVEVLRLRNPSDHESIALLDGAIAHATPIFLLSKARHQIDALQSLTKIAEDAPGTTEEKQAVCVAKAPVYLKERVVFDRQLPLVELNEKDKLRPWKVGGKKKKGIEEEEE